MQQQIIENMLKMQKNLDKIEVVIEKWDMETSDLKSIKGIWPSTIQLLHSHWIKTKEELETKTKEELEAIITNPITRKQIFNSLWI